MQVVGSTFDEIVLQRGAVDVFLEVSFVCVGPLLTLPFSCSDLFR